MSDHKPVPYLGTPQATIAVLEKYKFVFQKRFGQNFLIDPRVLDRIIVCRNGGTITETTSDLD